MTYEILYDTLLVYSLYTTQQYIAFLLSEINKLQKPTHNPYRTPDAHDVPSTLYFINSAGLDLPRQANFLVCARIKWWCFNEVGFRRETAVRFFVRGWNCFRLRLTAAAKDVGCRYNFDPSRPLYTQDTSFSVKSLPSRGKSAVKRHLWLHQ